MPIKSLESLPEIFVSSAWQKDIVYRGVKAGKLRKLASRLYTRNMTEDPEVIVRRHVWQIAGEFFPGGVIADRTALENMPAEDGSVCLVTEKGKDIKIPGLLLRPRRGAGPLEGDSRFVGNLYLSSTPRAFLENMRSSRRRDGKLPRTFTRQELEERLEAYIRRSGEDAVNKLRDEVRRIAPSLDLKQVH